MLHFESKLLRVLAAILAGAQALTASSALAELLDPEKAAIVALAVGAFQIALSTYRSAAEPESEESPDE